MTNTSLNKVWLELRTMNFHAHFHYTFENYKFTHPSNLHK